jgi:hypothetical protein
MAGGRRREKMREVFPPRRREKGQLKSQSPLSRRPCSPFSQTRGAGYINEERETVHAQQIYGGKLAAWLLVSGLGAMPHACSLAIECF